jgi:hypothetical protein
MYTATVQFCGAGGTSKAATMAGIRVTDHFLISTKFARENLDLRIRIVYNTNTD